MSRLIVKHLPKGITEDVLRALFSRHGTITDIQLKYTEEGSFRKFGFIGFQTDEEAGKAVTFLNNTFINTSKISVEKCAPLGDEKKPKAWSKYAPDSTAFKKAHKKEMKYDEKQPASQEVDKNEILEILEKYRKDPMFEDFLQVHNSADKLGKLKEKLLKSQSDNKDHRVHLDDNQDENKNTYLDKKLSEKPISDLEYMKMLMQKASSSHQNIQKKRRKMEKKPKEKIELFTLKLKDLPYKVKKKDIREFFRPNVPFSIRIPRNVHGIAFVGYKTEKGFKKALSKDKSFLKGKQILVTHYKVKNSDPTNNQNDPKKSKWKHQEDALNNAEHIAESGRIFLRNLAYTTTENDVEELFSKYGPITEVNLPIDFTTRKPKGFGVVTFMMPEHAVKAYSELDGSVLHGRMMHILPGNTKDDKLDNLEDSSHFKQKKTVKQKSQGGSAHNWNTLFLGHNAVAEVIADTYDIAKEVVVGPDGKGSAAVRLAIGETQIVTQTKKYLKDHGVLVDVFNSAPKSRSKTVILVKNLPAKTKFSEIREIFQKYGELGRVILPPNGATAIVEFFEPSEARKAFTRLAYSKFKHSPLYLEWAPENSLTEGKPSEDGINTIKEQAKEDAYEEVSRDVTDTSTQELFEKQVEVEEDEEEPEENTTLFVKNLNFNTTDEMLKKHFIGCGKIKYATIATKNDKSNPGRKLSMGYGFVQFYQKKSADKALKTLQQSVLDGKSLEIKRSERTLKNQVTAARKPTKLTKQTGSKILVRNVPFQANKKEIFELFSTFGELKALRLPKKMNIGSDSHRGFAFIDYVSAADAKAAFESLSQSTHLYGRRLVLEWAATEEGVDEIRKRTAEHFGTKDEVKPKKSVFNIE